jgi:hypothetical protein
VRLEGLGQLKKSSDLIGNGSHDLPACSIAPQPTMLPRVPKYIDASHSTVYKTVSSGSNKKAGRSTVIVCLKHFKVASSSSSDTVVDWYVIVLKLLNSILNIRCQTRSPYWISG